MSIAIVLTDPPTGAMQVATLNLRGGEFQWSTGSSSDGSNIEMSYETMQAIWNSWIAGDKTILMDNVQKGNLKITAGAILWNSLTSFAGSSLFPNDPPGRALLAQ